MSSQDFKITCAEPFSNTDTLVGSFDEKTEICTREETKICSHEVTAQNGRMIRKGRYLPYVKLTHDEKTRIYEIYHKLGRRPVHAEIARRLSEGRKDESSIRIKTVMAVDALINEVESGSVNLINKNDMSPVDLT
ncbi:19259_t:CDS:2, partial [Racocetra fulgida]